MTPQSNFMIVAPVLAERRAELESILSSMTDQPGAANPGNPIVPFGAFETIHYARFVILDDKTTGDLKYFESEVPQFPIALAFLADCDGAAEELLRRLATEAGDGLRKIYSCCEGFDDQTNLFVYMRRHSQPSSASYVNWIGRTVTQVREEAALRDALMQKLAATATVQSDPRRLWQDLVSWVRSEQQAGRLPLQSPAPTPFGWWLHNLIHLLIVPLAIIVLVVLLCLAPKLWILLLLLVAAFVLLLRHAEKTEPEIVVRAPPEHAMALAHLEDHDVTNQFTVVGSVKPSMIRRFTLAAVLYAIDYGARHILNKGHLGRIRTIHFARWAYLDGKKRVLFASNYDGSLESYMDDFINKVGWGLNMVFSNGVGYPRTHWLVSYGCKEEQKFKYTLRRHQVPTQVWYKAYPGLTAFDLARNTRVRQGIERRSMSDDEIRIWLSDF
jgi:hypothetical protein